MREFYYIAFVDNECEPKEYLRTMADDWTAIDHAFILDNSHFIRSLESEEHFHITVNEGPFYGYLALLKLEMPSMHWSVEKVAKSEGVCHRKSQPN